MKFSAGFVLASVLAASFYKITMSQNFTAVSRCRANAITEMVRTIGDNITAADKADVLEDLLRIPFAPSDLTQIASEFQQAAVGSIKQSRKKQQECNSIADFYTEDHWHVFLSDAAAATKLEPLLMNAAGMTLFNSVRIFIDLPR